MLNTPLSVKTAKRLLSIGGTLVRYHGCVDHHNKPITHIRIEEGDFTFAYTVPPYVLEALQSEGFNITTPTKARNTRHIKKINLGYYWFCN